MGGIVIDGTPDSDTAPGDREEGRRYAPAERRPQQCLADQDVCTQHHQVRALDRAVSS